MAQPSTSTDRVDGLLAMAPVNQLGGRDRSTNVVVRPPWARVALAVRRTASGAVAAVSRVSFGGWLMAAIACQPMLECNGPGSGALMLELSSTVAIDVWPVRLCFFARGDR